MSIIGIEKMRKRNVKEELGKYPCYKYVNGALIRIAPPTNWHGYHLHHYITTQWQQTHLETFKNVENLQKLIFLPPQMHMELHAKHSKFKEKYGIDIKELLFNWREYMISAKKAREKSEKNSITIRTEEVEKAITKAIEKGRTNLNLLGELPEEIIKLLEENGYGCEKVSNGYKVWW